MLIRERESMKQKKNKKSEIEIVKLQFNIPYFRIVLIQEEGEKEEQQKVKY